MVKKTKILKKSRFLNSVISLREAVVSDKSSTEKFQYSTREEYIEKIFKITMARKEHKFLKEDLIV